MTTLAILLVVLGYRILNVQAFYMALLAKNTSCT